GLGANTSLKTVRSQAYHCAFCNVDNEPTLDDMVEVSFTVNPRVRRIAAHNPDELPIWEYYRQVFFGSGVDLPDNELEAAMQQVTLDAVELPAGEKALLSLQLPPGEVIVLEPATHTAQIIDVKGAPTSERQNLAVVYHTVRSATENVTMRPGPLRLSLDNRTNMRVLPAGGGVDDAMIGVLGKRRPPHTPQRPPPHPTFRHLHRTQALAVDQ